MNPVSEFASPEAQTDITGPPCKFTHGFHDHSIRPWAHESIKVPGWLALGTFQAPSQSLHLS